jgi:hypothetical protein
MKLVATVIVLTCAVSSFGAVLVDEQFTHPNGSLVGQVPAPGPGGAWANHSGTAGQMQVTGNQAIVVMGGAASEDANTSFAAIGAGTTVYAAFDMMIPSGSTMGGENYFAHFRSAAFTYPGRVFAGAPTAAGDYSIGLRASTTAPTVLWATDLSFDVTYRVVVSYEFDTGNSQLWIDPAGQGSTSISDGPDAVLPGDAVASFALRQSTVFTANIAIDNLQVGTTFGDIPVELQTFSVE